MAMAMTVFLQSMKNSKNELPSALGKDLARGGISGESGLLARSSSYYHTSCIKIAGQYDAISSQWYMKWGDGRFILLHCKQLNSHGPLAAAWRAHETKFQPVYKLVFLSKRSYPGHFGLLGTQELCCVICQMTYGRHSWLLTLCCKERRL